MRGDISVSITTGIENVHFAVTNEGNLIIHHCYAPYMDHSIPLGRCTVRQLERLQENLERLKVHAIPEI
jgi:hypothetical protein